MMKTIIILVLFVYFTHGDLILSADDYCTVENRDLKCQCNRNGKLDMFYRGNNTHILSVFVSDCDSTSIPQFMGIALQQNLKAITIHNIKESLAFDPILHNEITALELVNIRRIPVIQNYSGIESLKSFRAENVSIGVFKEQSTFEAMESFTLINVEIKYLENLEIMKKTARNLTIINCNLIVEQGNLRFESFDTIEIVNTTFEFRIPGEIALKGKSITLLNNIFFNATVNITGDKRIEVNDTCADGKSLLRFNSNNKIDIISFNNKLPGNISYSLPPNWKADKQSNNTICKGAHCNCQRNNARSIRQQLTVVSYFFIMLICVVKIEEWFHLNL